MNRYPETERIRRRKGREVEVLSAHTTLHPRDFVLSMTSDLHRPVPRVFRNVRRWPVGSRVKNAESQGWRKTIGIDSAIEKQWTRRNAHNICG